MKRESIKSDDELRLTLLRIDDIWEVKKVRLMVMN